MSFGSNQLHLPQIVTEFLTDEAKWGAALAAVQPQVGIVIRGWSNLKPPTYI